MVPSMAETPKRKLCLVWVAVGVMLTVGYVLSAYPAFMLVRSGYLPNVTHRLYVPLANAWYAVWPDGVPPHLRKASQLDALRRLEVQMLGSPGTSTTYNYDW